MDRAAITDRLRRFEATTDYMYRRRTGEVAIGVGHVIPSAEVAQRIPWYGTPTSIAIAADYERVRSAVKGLRADAYAKLSKIRLDAESVESMLETDIRNHMTDLRRSVRELSSYPEPVQQGLFDIAFNAGAMDRLQYRKLLNACDARDWTTAALESRRQGIPEERNAEVAALIAGAVNTSAPSRIANS